MNWLVKWALPMFIGWIQANDGVVKITYKGVRFNLMLVEADVNGVPIMPPIGNEVTIE